MGIFFDGLNLETIIAFILYCLLLAGLNELGNRSLKSGIIMYLIVPLIGVFIVWPITAKGTNMDNWFSHAKVLSSAAGALIFVGLRFSTRIRRMKWYYTLPALILAINMAEAVIREFEVATYTTPVVVDGMQYVGGIWNNINAWAGLINLLLISGWFGIVILKDKHNTMCWPDMVWTWVIGYDLWNAVYCYNVLGSRGFYALSSLLIATVIAHKRKDGSWLQHRAGTLAVMNYVMFTFPHLLFRPELTVTNAWNPVVMTSVAVIALVWNVVIAVIQVKLIIKNKRNPLTDEINTEHPEYLSLSALDHEIVE